MASSPGARRRSVATSTAALAVSLLAGLAGIASAAGSSAVISAGGGAAAPGVPTIRDVICLSGCVGLRKATVGGTVQVSGRNLAEVTKMTFAGDGTRVAAAVTKASDTAAEAQVPIGAINGKVRVKDDFGNASKMSAVALEIHPRSELGTAGRLQLIDAEATPRRAFFFGVRAPRLTYVIGSDQALNDLRIDVVDADGAVVKSFFRDDVAANSTQSIRWNAKASDGKAAHNGSYQFRISSQAGVRAVRASRRDGGSLGFKLFGYIFPLRATHDFGGAGGRFGAPRSGHTHQGQDVLAACGSKLVAARGGRVKYSGYQGAAGNYLVINGKATGIDTVYMHLRNPSPLHEGDVVRTGQPIGVVGQTGDATGCHLHFEMWTPPGWYTGGHPFDPLPYLLKWDRYS